MSHHKIEHITCPNCGFSASRNYCAQCGQETHLHKETFVGLVVHFVGHYFHYDSKFWQTLKTLLFKPGRLTLAYWENKRMRYLPPISLYIFVSLVFFISTKLGGDTVQASKSIEAPTVEVKSVDTTKEFKDLFPGLNEKLGYLNENSPEANEFSEKLQSAAPKIFFLMVPFLAWVLQLMFIDKRRQLSFVHHAIFALHYHALWFAAMALMDFIALIPLGNLITPWLGLASFLFTIIYFVVAAKNVYKIGWLRSILTSIFIGIAYTLCILFVFIAVILNI